VKPGLEREAACLAERNAKTRSDLLDVQFEQESRKTQQVGWSSWHDNWVLSLMKKDFNFLDIHEVCLSALAHVCMYVRPDMRACKARDLC